MMGRVRYVGERVLAMFNWKGSYADAKKKCRRRWDGVITTV